MGFSARSTPSWKRRPPLCYLLALLSAPFIVCLGLWKESYVGLWISGGRHVSPCNVWLFLQHPPTPSDIIRSCTQTSFLPSPLALENPTASKSIFSLSTFLSMVSCTLSLNPNIFSGSSFWKQQHENHSPEAANNKACCIPEQQENK